MSVGDEALPAGRQASLLLDVFQSIQKRGLPFLLVLTGLPTLFPKLVAELPNCDVEFTVQEIVEQSQKLAKPFSAGHVNQILGKLMENGLPYKNRHGRYSFAAPLLGDFIRRQEAEA